MPTQVWTYLDDTATVKINFTCRLKGCCSLPRRNELKLTVVLKSADRVLAEFASSWRRSRTKHQCTHRYICSASWCLVQQHIYIIHIPTTTGSSKFQFFSLEWGARTVQHMPHLSCHVSAKPSPMLIDTTHRLLVSCQSFSARTRSHRLCPTVQCRLLCHCHRHAGGHSRQSLASAPSRNRSAAAAAPAACRCHLR